MDQPIACQSVCDQLAALDPDDPQYAASFVDDLLNAAFRFGASDVHLQPQAENLNLRWRIDGVLQNLGDFPPGTTADVITRLKVLAQLLTYRTEVPQEGRLSHEQVQLKNGPDSALAASRAGNVEMRVSTFPTIYGERAVIRLFASATDLKQLDQLGLPPEITASLQHCLGETTGALLITGPAGSGKTTTSYACLRHVVEATRGGRSIVSLEDPVEVAVPGVAQSQVNAAHEFDLNAGLRSLLRQDPEVILVGEIRDRETAAIAFQAALTGQLLVSTFHSGSAAEAVSRLIDMGIEPYVLRSSILAIVHQRLVRKLCECATWSSDESDRLGLPIAQTRVVVGCDACQQTGYSGRTLIAEMLCPRDRRGVRELLSREGVNDLEQKAVERGMSTRWDLALSSVAAGVTSATEVRRVLGFGVPVIGGEVGGTQHE